MAPCTRLALSGGALLLLLGAAPRPAAGGGPPQPSAMTTGGPVLGLTTANGGAAFLGVPFAQNPPVRWGPPRPPTGWTAPLNATAYGSGCLSFAPRREDASSALPQAEECLTVNVWVPPTRALGAPMLVWIHGGGFVGGDGSGDFQLLSASTGAVVVSVNYRLGSLGFLALDGMAAAFPTPDAPDAACANVGLLDQQMALAWASANAASFGCDPAHVLIMGESAGGSSILFQLTLPGSYPFYRAALAQSPGSPVNDLAQGRATAAAIAARLGCPAGAPGGFAAQLACLRAAPADSVVSAAVAVAGTNDLPLTLGPVADGALVTASPAAKLLAGDFNRDATVLVSQCLFEGDSLLNGFTHSVTINASVAQAALEQLGVSVGFNASETASVGAAYAPIAARDGLFNGSSRIWGDGLIVCATRWASRGAAAFSNRPVHRFLFNTTFGGETAGRATHGTDLAVIFSGAAPPVARAFWAWLTNAAVTGDVNRGPANASTAWPAYTTAGGGGTGILVANEVGGFSVIDAWQEELCDGLWLPILP